MAGLPWVRLDTGFPQNPKILALIADRKHRAVVGYVCALAWSGAHGTDGFVPDISLSVIHLDRGSAGWLVAESLFHEAPGGYQINDWADYQQSTAETAERSASAQKAARIRWDRVRRNGSQNAG